MAVSAAQPACMLQETHGHESATTSGVSGHTHTTFRRAHCVLCGSMCCQYNAVRANPECRPPRARAIAPAGVRNTQRRGRCAAALAGTGCETEITIHTDPTAQSLAFSSSRPAGLWRGARARGRSARRPLGAQAAAAVCGAHASRQRLLRRIRKLGLCDAVGRVADRHARLVQRRLLVAQRRLHADQVSG
jgi:hypothetical protein